LPEPPPLREVIGRHGLAARRSLGQHFLLDMNLTRRIARAAGDMAGVTAIEIGPGPGGLTRALLETDAERVVAIERDRRCIAALAELDATSGGRLEVIHGDALEIDVAGLAGGAPARIVANLPYNVATPLLIGWLRRADAVQSMTLMFQKEVAQRLGARAGGASYGRLSVITSWRCKVELLFDVSPQAFVPPPRVTSTVVQLTPRPRPLAPARMTELERVTAAAFGQRRKMLRSSLKALFDDPVPVLERLEIPPTARAEELDVESFCAISRAIRPNDEMA
jgi:16S rRNA (adenine1518-N6/adenine1519-N6)-dimethyltransferase